MHGIHINLTWERLILGRLGHIRIYILIDWDLDLNLLTAPLSNRFDEPRKARMRIDSLVENKLRLGVWVNFCQVLFIFFYFIDKRLITSQINMILCTKYTYVGRAHNLQSIRFEKVCEYMPPVLQLVLAGEELRGVDGTVVGLRRHGLDHPAAELGHEDDVVFG